MRFVKRNIAVSNLLLALAMATFVVMPLVGAFWTGTHSVESSMEHRQLAGLPPLPRTLHAWTKFPKAFDAYAHDQFGFRDDLLRGYRWLLTSVFHESTSWRAFVGRDGWLYFTGDESLADMQGISPYTDAELRNAVAQINARGELLAVRHVRYGFVVFPDKHTVYPQFLPRGVYAGFEHRRLNALDAAMARTGHAYYLDASIALRRDAEHSPFQLYYKSDTHWNPWGAWLGYRAWVAASEPRLGLRRYDFRFDQFRIPRRSFSGGLSRMSGYHPYDPAILPSPDTGCEGDKAWRVPDAMLRRLHTVASHMRTAGCNGHGTALIVHDSFMDSIERYVTSNFKRSWLVWQYVDDRNFGWLVDQLHPGTVLVERVERLMGKFPETNLAALVRELGVVGESTAIDGHGELVIGGNGNRKTPVHQPVAGALDRVVRDGDRIHVEGWARMGKSTPAAVIAVIDGKVVGEAPVALYRPDVAAAHHDPSLTWSGFRIDLPGASWKGNQGLRLYFVDFDTYGEFRLSNRDQHQP